MSKLPTVWDLAPHTKAKHDILRGYLGAWFAIFGHTPHHTRVVFLDGFAGPGVYSKGEEGSPVLSLQTLLDHDHFSRWGDTEFIFVFNEFEKPRHASLESVLSNFQASRHPWPSNVQAFVENQAFGDLVEELLTSLGKSPMAPAFAFIDPFGFKDVALDQIRRLLRYRHAELFIYFDFNNVNRFAQAGNVDEHLEALFGTEEYKLAPPAGDPDRGPFLHDLYERQLRTVCNFAHVQSFAMYNEQGHLGNYLFFCTRDTDAFDAMKSVMWKLDPSGGYRFEDRLAGQPVLFQPNADTGPLRAALTQQFSGQTVSIEVVRKYVIEETPYYAGQLKVKTLRPMQRDGLITSPNQARPGFFPDGTLIAFS